jgi:hypothetical protein
VLAAVLFTREDEHCLGLAHKKAAIFHRTAEGWRVEPMNEAVFFAGSDDPVLTIDIAGAPPAALRANQPTICPDRGDRITRRAQPATPTARRGQRRPSAAWAPEPGACRRRLQRAASGRGGIIAATTIGRLGDRRANANYALPQGRAGASDPA